MFWSEMSQEYVLVSDPVAEVVDAAASRALGSLVKGLCAEMKAVRRVSELEEHLKRLSDENEKLKEKLSLAGRMTADVNDFLGDPDAGIFNRKLGFVFSVSQFILSAALFICVFR